MIDVKCKHQTFLINYINKGRTPYIKNLILKMTVNRSGVRDTGRVLDINSKYSYRDAKKGR